MRLGTRTLLGGFLLAVTLLLNSPRWQTARAQVKTNEPVEIKTSPKFMAAFRDCVAKAAASTVRVQCGGKNTALGVVVKADGYILTKASDLTGEITVQLKDGQVLDAKKVGHHEPHDLAMLKVDAVGLTVIEWSESKLAPVGHFVASVGPAGNPVAVGVMSVASRNMPPKDPKAPDPKSGYLGVGLADFAKGAKVSQVFPNTAAAKARIKVDDIIVSVADKEIKDAESLIKTLQKYKPGDTVELKILRDDEEVELKATLGKRPPDRADFQNNMGSKLSNRRTGFPVILQHDSVVLPEDCGGPLVDLDGRVIGLNIARAGRVETYAIPAEVIRPLLADLISGKLAPKKQ
jgi:serine protease Do